MATILVVDDHATNRELLKTILGYQGHRVLEAGDARDALRVAQATRPDLIISDILMLTMDGFEFVRQLRDDLTIGTTPVVLSSTLLEPRDRKSGGSLRRRTHFAEAQRARDNSPDRGACAGIPADGKTGDIERVYSRARAGRER